MTRFSLIRHALIVGGAAALVSLSFVNAQTWVNPTGVAPQNNVPAPLNVGATAQTKEGALTVKSDLKVGGALRGLTGDRLPISGKDGRYTVEVGLVQDKAGIVGNTDVFNLQSGGGQFKWYKADGTLQLTLDANRALILESDGTIRRNGSDRVRFVPGNDTNAYVELGSVQSKGGVAVGTDTMQFQSGGGAFQWYKANDAAAKLILDASGELRIPGKLCLNIGSITSPTWDCRNTWPSSTSGGTLVEKDTLATVTDASRGTGYNQTAANTAIRIQGTLTVDQSVTATAYLLSSGAKVVTSQDYGHTTNSSGINADTVDGKHAQDIIDAAAAKAVTSGAGAKLQCGVTRATIPYATWGKAPIGVALCKNASATSGTAYALDSSLSGTRTPNARTVSATAILASNNIVIGDATTAFFRVGGGCYNQSSASTSTQFIGSFPVDYAPAGSKLPGWSCEVAENADISVYAVCCTTQ